MTSRYEIDNNTKHGPPRYWKKMMGHIQVLLEGKDYLLSYSARGRMEWRFISFIPVESLTSEMGYILQS